MDLSTTGKWLEEALLQLFTDGDSGLQLDSETLHTLVSYCDMAPPADASEYLLNILGHDKCKDLLPEYMQRRGGMAPIPNVKVEAYHKPRDEEARPVGTKKSQKPRPGAGEAAGSNLVGQNSDLKSPLLSGHGVLSSQNIVQKGKRTQQKAKKGGKGLSLAEASKGQTVFARNGPCNCQCTRHKLINNCLSCGRIVCEQEGEGPCTFCGALVLREGSDYGGLEGLPVPPATEAEAAAEEFKNKLVDYDRNAASRTSVIDDQSDYFKFEGDVWLTDKEKEDLRNKKLEEERIAEERRKQVVVTVDLVGRKVVLAGQDDGSKIENGVTNPGNEIPAGHNVHTEAHVRPNPQLSRAPPIFVEPRHSAAGRGSKTRQSVTKRSSASTVTGRVQHDDPYVEALRDSNLYSNGKGERELTEWNGSKARASGGGEAEPGFHECQLEAPTEQELRVNGSKATASGRDTDEMANQRLPFDICLTKVAGNQNAVALKPSILVQKQTERKEAQSLKKQPNSALLPGMVLLKGWLSLDQQVDIVKECRTLGKGPGGFYKPQFDENNKMHLQMMCLGMQWEPQSNAYGPRRPLYDNAPAPAIPNLFTSLVDKALAASRAALAHESRGKPTKVELGKHSIMPDMVANVCIVNFYERGGNLGMHQDKDESEESLKKGIPVVSFSIGDSAEFLYGKQRDQMEAEKTILESGDVLVFGGPARMIYHGVTEVLSNTGPTELYEKTSLRAGRLNLTFRQY